MYVCIEDMYIKVSSLTWHFINWVSFWNFQFFRDPVYFKTNKVDFNQSKMNIIYILYLLFLLFRDAIDEILRETHRGAIRAEVSGSWRPPTSKINSRLFNNTLIQTLQSNNRHKNMKQNGAKNSSWIQSIKSSQS